MNDGYIFYAENFTSEKQQNAEENKCKENTLIFWIFFEEKKNNNSFNDHMNKEN